ncbi:MAG TPA: hypothetical protein VMR90_16620 [Candidatus Cybelea sp.]|nr:hypothetical protein [Candidatus Cybelea sp.]
MKALRLRMAWLLPMAALVWAGAARAQAPLGPAQMSARTLFYVTWHGMPGGEARKANALAALWDDADFAPVRSAIVAGMLSSSEEKPAAAKLTPEQVKEFAGLLENSFTLGYVSEPVRRMLSNGAVSADTKRPAWNGMFFVYDRTGKELLLAKAILRMRAEEKEAPVLSQVSIGGVQVVKSESKGGATYWAEHGKYAVSAGERTVMEDLLGRLDGKASGGATLGQSAAYQEAKANLESGSLEFFLAVPDLKNLAADSKAGPLEVSPLLEAAKLDAVHSVSGRVTFEGAKTHVQAAILGDASGGTLFDIWSAGQPRPASLAFVPAEAVSYNSMQLDLLGIYATVERVAGAAFPQTQQGGVGLLDLMAQQKLGMPVPEALGLLSGEFASMQTSPALEMGKQVYFFGVRKKAETLKLMRTVLGEQLTAERNEGDVTFLKISLEGKEGSAGTAQWNFFNVAVTPDMLVGANGVETLREVLANRAHASAAAGLGTVPQFRTGRAAFPENVNGLSYFDFQKVDWQAVKARWVAEAKKSAAAQITNLSTDATKDVRPSAAADWLSQINPQVFARHLHYSSSVSWKDARGIHWDQWVQ